MGNNDDFGDDFDDGFGDDFGNNDDFGNDDDFNDFNEHLAERGSLFTKTTILRNGTEVKTFIFSFLLFSLVSSFSLSSLSFFSSFFFGQIISSTNANGNDVSPPPLVLCLQFEKWMTFPLRSMNEDVTKPKTEITRMVPPGGIRSMVRRATLDEEYRKVMGTFLRSKLKNVNLEIVSLQ